MVLLLIVKMLMIKTIKELNNHNVHFWESRYLLIKVLILLIIDLPSPSSPASRQQLSKICLVIMLAVYGLTFLNSFNFTTNSSFGLNSKVRFLKSALGFPS